MRFCSSALSAGSISWLPSKRLAALGDKFGQALLLSSRKELVGAHVLNDNQGVGLLGT